MDMENETTIWDRGTLSFQKKMQPAALKIYQTIFPDCKLQELKAEDGGVHPLDQHFAIDRVITLSSGVTFSLQEKYRQNYYLRFMDFTQEYKNAHGTTNETKGEWFKLYAQLYFYGWANKEETAFEKWILMDITKYKMVVEQAGGLDQIGQFNINEQYGGASFYGIPIIKLDKAILKSNIDGLSCNSSGATKVTSKSMHLQSFARLVTRVNKTKVQTGTILVEKNGNQYDVL